MQPKYEPLYDYLVGLPGSQSDITLTFQQIEEILHDGLPQSAHFHRAWWSNELRGRHVQAIAWLDAGWKVDTPDLTQKWVRFVRLR